jgi:hypothetical protein
MPPILPTVRAEAVTRTSVSSWQTTVQKSCHPSGNLAARQACASPRRPQFETGRDGESASRECGIKREYPLRLGLGVIVAAKHEDHVPRCRIALAPCNAYQARY